MTLSERIQAAQACRVQDCDRRRHPDAAVCREDLDELWHNRLDRQPDGTYVRRRTFAVRDFTGQIASHAA